MFWIWKERVAELERKIGEAQQEIQVIQGRGQLLFRHGTKFAKQIEGFFEPQFAANEAALKDELSDCATVDVRGWEADYWQSWEASEALLNDYIKIGANVESRGDREFAVPHFAPFIGDNRTLIIVSDDRTADDAIALLQSLAIRIALTLPHQSRFTLLDPVGAGSAFLMQKFLPFVRESGDDIRRDLDQVSAEIKRIISTYLDASADSFELLPEDIRVNERLEFILASNFPCEYDRRAIEALYSIGKTGPRAGKYLILHYNQSRALPRDMSMDGFENAAYISLDGGYGRLDPTACQLKFVPDRAPSSHLQTELFEKLSKAKPPQRDLAWDKTVALASENWWQEKAQVLIETPVGGFGSKELLKVWFGDKGESQCAHGILGGTTGSGKSTLYHVIIMGLAIRYAPDDLKMYLVDGKSGVTFQPYRDLPHAEVVSLHTMPELSRSVLAELIAEMDYRYEVFGSTGVEKLADYYGKGQPQGKLPRILLLVDEYQELFEGDQDGIASSHLQKLSAQGRGAGIHMLLGSQGFGAVGMLHRDEIFRNIHLNMAMRMRPEDIQSLTNFGRSGKQLIMNCDLPGKIVLNDQLDDKSNKLGKVALLKSDERDRLVQQLHHKAHDQFSPDDLPLRIVLDGKEQPNLIENPQLRNLLEHSTWLIPQEWQTKARLSRQQNGLGVADWFSAERPRAIWLGQEFSVRGQAMIVTRRRIAENVVLVGSENTATYGMLAGMLVSLATNLNPQTTEFYILDRSMAETQWCEALQAVHRDVLVPAGFSSKFTRSVKDIGGYVDTLLAELERRISLEDDERIAQTSIFAIMTELDKVDEIRRQMDEYGTAIYSELGEKLRRLCVDGSRLGIHVILSFSGLKAMLNVIDDRRDLANFRHRVALQMSEDDSFTFVRNRTASRLQLDGSKPISALYLDVESDRSVRFKPYSTESTIPLAEQLQQVAETVTQWSQKS